MPRAKKPCTVVDLSQLEYVRQSHDWSYQELADRIATVTNFRRNQDCYRKIAQGITTAPNKRTKLALTKFFEHLALLQKAAGQ